MKSVRSKHRASAARKKKRKIRTGGFVDEIDEDDFDVEEEEASTKSCTECYK